LSDATTSLPSEQADRDARGTMVQRLRARAVATVAWIACRLPERAVMGAADLAGTLTFHVARGRRRWATANLHRIAAWLADQGLGPEEARLAATDPRALDRLVRSAFRHHARYVVELARAPVMTERYIRDHLTVETPEALAEMLASEPVIAVGMHFGAIELPGFYAWGVGRRRGVAPMEAVADPELARWYSAIRGKLGIRVVGLREARRELVEALRRGKLVGIVADRDITGGGAEVELFGHPARLPLGPALLLLEEPAPAYLITVRRLGGVHYAGRVEALPAPPSEGSRRERATAFLAGEARAFERAVALAPDQWLAVFHPIWPDLEGPGRDDRRRAAARGRA
jgi:lauroyl/myristoyl acyltransferase